MQKEPLVHMQTQVQEEVPQYFQQLHQQVVEQVMLPEVRVDYVVVLEVE